MSNSQNTLTIFFDGKCPLCVAEMNHLKRIDHANVIHLIDLHMPRFNVMYPEISFEEAMRVLHGKYQGTTLIGLEVTRQAWTLVGKGIWVAPLGWPGLKKICHLIYLLFAKNRQLISAIAVKIFGLKKTQCNAGTCREK